MHHAMLATSYHAEGSASRHFPVSGASMGMCHPKSVYYKERSVSHQYTHNAFTAHLPS